LYLPRMHRLAAKPASESRAACDGGWSRRWWVAVEAELVDEIGGCAEAEAARLHVVQERWIDRAVGLREEVGQRLADVVLAARSRRAAEVELPAAHARREGEAVERAHRHLLEALAADDRTQLDRARAAVERRERAFVGPAVPRDATERHADAGGAAVVCMRR